MTAPTDPTGRTAPTDPTTRTERTTRIDRTARTTRIWRITGVVTVLVVLVTGAGQTLAVVAKQERVEDTVYPVAVHRIQLVTGSASVRIRPGSDGQVLLTKTLDWTVSEPKVKVDVSAAGVMNVDVQCRRQLSFYNCGAQIDLKVPPGVEVGGLVTSGSVELEDLTGPVALEGTSGAINLNRLTGPVHARTTSGMVQGSELKSNRVEATSDSGSVQLDFATAPANVNATTNSGSVTVTLPRDSHYRINSRTGSGSSQIDGSLGDASSPNSLVAAVGSGSLQIGYNSGR
ncbi:DUF4097 family beta strand repeat-containing protein [Streptomyces sp. NRRL WC-3742]|uniref:DUF4097 family beta strand repeat-containing protein n=1 Tax=Streptomyces sp. NRRL WC-3742 TaxID=1463934 RepID=UPI0004C5897C|nr:DUF4097 family beta strand repeat-containing protein [Streptomyces sp. NRRL WC-3742]